VREKVNQRFMRKYCHENMEQFRNGPALGTPELTNKALTKAIGPAGSLSTQKAYAGPK